MTGYELKLCDQAARFCDTLAGLRFAGVGGLAASESQCAPQSPFRRLIRGVRKCSACPTRHLAPGRFRRICATYARTPTEPGVSIRYRNGRVDPTVTRRRRREQHKAPAAVAPYAALPLGGRTKRTRLPRGEFAHKGNVPGSLIVIGSHRQRSCVAWL